MTNTLPRIRQPKDAYIIEYPIFVEMAKKQNSVFWLDDEIKVEKDKQDVLVNLTRQEKHGVIYTLKLFTKYERRVGEDYWGGIFAKRYPRPELVRMAQSFAFFETNVHAPFYNKINEVLGLDTEEFYNSYVEDPVLKERMEFIDQTLESADELLSIAGFSLIEGAVLYSNFAFLKHFQSEGKNKMVNIVRGINFSVRDENIHSEAGATVFKIHKSELNLSAFEEEMLELRIREIVRKIREHEFRIIDNLFAYVNEDGSIDPTRVGHIDGITPTQMKHFVESRLNKCLENLGYKKEFDVAYNPIAKWFYKGINNFQFNDFFSGMGREYQRDWSRDAFVWKGKKK